MFEDQTVNKYSKLNKQTWCLHLNKECTYISLRLGKAMVEPKACYEWEIWLLNRKGTLASINGLLKVNYSVQITKIQVEQPILDRIKRRQVEWYENLHGNDDCRWPKLIYEGTQHVSRRRGRHKKSWKNPLAVFMRSSSTFLAFGNGETAFICLLSNKYLYRLYMCVRPNIYLFQSNKKLTRFNSKNAKCNTNVEIQTLILTTIQIPVLEDG